MQCYTHVRVQVWLPVYGRSSTCLCEQYLLRVIGYMCEVQVTGNISAFMHVTF